MKESRRSFLMTVAALSPLVLENTIVFAQSTGKKSPFPNPPPSAETQNPAEQLSKHDSPAAKRAALQQNEKEFRAGVGRLYELTSELKQEID